MEEDSWTCAICYQVLVDPVVGRCGHDYCKTCLLLWADRVLQKPGQPGVPCPQCRCELASTLEEVYSIGICVRVKQCVEALFQEKVQERRRELAAVELPPGVRGVVAQRAQSQQRARVGRTRYIRARRTRGPSASPPPTFPLTAHVAQQPQLPAVPAATAATSAQQPAQAAAQPSSVWVGPPVVCFTMGWWERSETTRRRARGGARRM
uniref:RING-type domain-containing protein n=1 Tax=Chlamydomonas leiostraca TaxID=1034604 RepID=A0A7S0RY74_9CHLO|mmetsp:Transcript_34799/g.88159  ORF Transcript_34799/g.88159 Transcript_34799/m.88159 type:complete len:208 (+) Transcript_34799:71-694(+)